MRRRFAVIEQLLLKVSSSTKLVRQSTREERDERNKNRSKDRFREIKTWELEWLNNDWDWYQRNHWLFFSFDDILSWLFACRS